MPGEFNPAHWNFDRWLAALGLVLAIIPLAFRDFRSWALKVASQYWRPALVGFSAALILVVGYGERGVAGLVGALVLCFLTFALWVAQRFRTWRPYQKCNRGRWENLTTIYYGHLEYEPFLHYRRNDGNPAGIGIELLERLLEFPLGGKKVEVKPFQARRNWNDVLDGLIQNNYDVVATPLFATFDRSKHVAFTAPLCFSNVGLYVRTDVANLTALTNLTIDNLRSAIEKSALEFLCVKGEISEKLAAKYGDRDSTVSEGSGTILPSLFEKINAHEHPHYALFCESFYAENQQLVKERFVVNVLPPHGILYPVCFAVRQGDYQLVNLLNIRLLQFNQNGGALPLLAAEWERHQGVEAKNIKQHFVAEWPCKSALPIV